MFSQQLFLPHHTLHTRWRFFKFQSTHPFRFARLWQPPPYYSLFPLRGTGWVEATILGLVNIANFISYGRLRHHKRLQDFPQMLYPPQFLMDPTYISYQVLYPPDDPRELLIETTIRIVYSINLYYMLRLALLILRFTPLTKFEIMGTHHIEVENYHTNGHFKLRDPPRSLSATPPPTWLNDSPGTIESNNDIMESPTPISIIAWSARGVWQRVFRNVARDIVSAHRPHIFIVLESRIPQPEASTATETLGIFFGVQHLPCGESYVSLW